MGPVTLDPAQIPVALDSPFGITADFHGTHYEGDAAGMGNPHLVLFVDDPATARVTQHGPHLEHDERFPKRTNVEFVRITPGATDEVDMRVWERGVGETLSCGTGACATAAVAHHRGLVGEHVTVHVPGGDLTVELGDTHPPRRTRRARLRRRVEVEARMSRRRLTATETDFDVLRQRALLVGTGIGTRDAEAAQASLDELALLVDTAGADPVELVLQRRDAPDPATYIGSGKAKELQELAETLDVDLVVFDDELTPAQQRNLEKLFKVDVVDRVALILDIFAQHARSQEGMVQVELAQLRYRLPAPARSRPAAQPAGRRWWRARGTGRQPRSR